METTLSQSLYKFEAILHRGHKQDRWVFDKINADWGHMLFSGATSFWETMRGAWDFENAGSLCHGWSAIPIYFFQAHLLGIKPIEPGFKTFCVDPKTSVVQQMSGTVPTPYGLIRLSWTKNNNGTVVYQLCHPKKTTPVFRSASQKDQIQIISEGG